jgi:hypothetical protein
MLVAVVLIELAVARQLAAFTNMFAEDWRLTGRAAGRKAVHCQVVCFGDSLVKFGVQPAVIEERTGGRVYNLALYRGQTPSSYFLLRHVLRSGARPAEVVVDADPHLLEHDPLASVRPWAELCDVSDLLDLAWESGDVSFPGRALTAQAIPSLRSRAEIRAWVLAALSGDAGVAKAALKGLWRNWRVNRGAQLMPANPAYPEELIAKSYGPAGWSPRPINLRYARRFLDLAARHGVRVFWVIPPVNPLVQDRRERCPLDAQHAGLLAALLADFPNLVVVDGRRSGYDRRAFHDATHLCREGAVALSAEIGDLIGRPYPAAPGSRWTRLQPFRARNSAAPMEDLMESHHAIARAPRRDLGAPPVLTR